MQKNQNGIVELIETEEEKERRLDLEESVRKRKAILYVVLPMLVAFLAFTYFFLNSLEEQSKISYNGLNLTQKHLVSIY